MGDLEVSVAHNGWAAAESPDFPGVLYVRGRKIRGHWRATEIYLDGRGEVLQSAVVRRLPIALVEQVIQDEGHEGHLLEKSFSPDLSRLASSFASGGFSYRRRRLCSACDAPVHDHPGPDGRDRAITDWIQLAYLAFLGLVPQPRMASKPRPTSPEAEDFVLTPPRPGKGGMTDEFLSDVARAYQAAVQRGLPPAVELAKQTGFDSRTVQGWFYKARKRGLMAPAARQGRTV